MKILLPALVTIILVSGCTSPAQTQPSEQDYIRAETACKLLCKSALNSGQDLSSGPCLSNDLLQDGLWVCDVAHFPRHQTDNDPANQCPAFGQSASYFIEIDQSCIQFRES